MKELKVIRFLLPSTGDLPLRGHTNEEGNLQQLFNVCFDEHQWLDNGSYLSHDIMNETIEIMPENILQSVLVEIRKAPVFAILADETTDSSNIKQLIGLLCIRIIVPKSTECYRDVNLILCPCASGG